MTKANKDKSTMNKLHQIICAKGFPSAYAPKNHTSKNPASKSHISKTLSSKILVSMPSKSPASKTSKSVVLGIGANIGTQDKILARFWHLLCFFASHSRIFGISTSPIYRNPPFGYANQAHFYNALVTLSTSLSLLQIYALVFYAERKFGRVRKREFKNAPRMIDIDIIFYSDCIFRAKYLTLPHPSYHNRASVLIPMLCLLYQQGKMQRYACKITKSKDLRQNKGQK